MINRTLLIFCGCAGLGTGAASYLAAFHAVGSDMEKWLYAFSMVTGAVAVVLLGIALLLVVIWLWIAREDDHAMRVGLIGRSIKGSADA